MERKTVGAPFAGNTRKTDTTVPKINKNGITLIALVITIIILLILAGITISLTIGEHGILNIAKQTGVKTEQEAAREKLELALLDLQAKKYTDENYSNDDIKPYLQTKDITLEGDIATVNNWKFEVNLESLTIKKEQGQSEIRLSKEVKEYLGKNENDKYEATVLVTIESNQEIKQVEFENTDGTTFTVNPNQSTFTKDMQIEFDREYSIKIETQDGKSETKKIIETSKETISSEGELVAFRDKVNKGLTYEGKTINLVKNLNLSSICYKVDGTVEKDVSWEPIANYGEEGEEATHIFKGTFNGNYHVIDYLYINTDKNYQGLFGYVDGGSIAGIVIGEHTNITGNGKVGSIVGCTKYTTISECGSFANISGVTQVGGIIGYSLQSDIIGTYNKGRIEGDSFVGGIVGESEQNVVNATSGKRYYYKV